MTSFSSLTDATSLNGVTCDKCLPSRFYRSLWVIEDYSTCTTKIKSREILQCHWRPWRPLSVQIVFIFMQFSRNIDQNNSLDPEREKKDYFLTRSTFCLQNGIKSTLNMRKVVNFTHLNFKTSPCNFKN